jgi:pimeloyl-ACP methyl ester carboxylesterase
VARWRGLKALVHDAIDSTTDLVGEGHASTHRAIQRVTQEVPGLGPVDAVQRGVHLGTRGTLASVKAVNRLVEWLSDAALDASVPSPTPDGEPVPQRSDIVGSAAWVADAGLGALNGTVGDHLARTGNPLDLGFQLRHGDRYLGPDDALDGALLVLIHGLGTTEWCWSLDAEQAFGDPAATYGTRLGEAHGLTPVYARYNTGRRIQENGLALAEALERHAASAERVVLLGHSMGGLVARSACHQAAQAGHTWLAKTDWTISVGTPHQGAPLARFGATATSGLDAVDLPTTRILARILAGRSAGVRDLEHGELLGRDPDATAAPEDRVVPLQEGLRYAFLATTLTQDPEHPVGRLLGDLLVLRASAEGPLLHEDFPVHREVVGGLPHARTQADPDILARLSALLGR